MRTRSQFKFPFLPGGANEKPEAVPPNKYARASGFFSSAKFAPGRNSNSIFGQRALKKTQRRFRRREKTQVPVGFFAAKCVLGRNVNSHFLRRAVKKNIGAVSPKQNASASGFFGGEMRTRSQL